jgi:F-type H+-transporting ATPase subunit alpha
MVSEFEKNFIAQLNHEHSEILNRIKQGQYDDEITDVLKKVAAQISDKMTQKA